MDTQQREPVSGPRPLNISQDSTGEDDTTQRSPAATDDTPNAELLLGQDARNAHRAHDPAEFELLLALRIRRFRWIFEIPHRHAPHATRVLASIRLRLPMFKLPSQYSTVEAVTLFIAATGVFILYSLLDSRSPIFQAKQDDFVPLKYIDRTNAGPDFQPYIDGLSPYAAISLQILGSLLSLAISQGWLINTAKLTNTAFTNNNNSTTSASREEGSSSIAGTAGDLLLTIVRVWLRAE